MNDYTHINAVSWANYNKMALTGCN
jgi:hypothetical protein